MPTKILSCYKDSSCCLLHLSNPVKCDGRPLQCPLDISGLFYTNFYAEKAQFIFAVLILRDFNNETSEPTCTIILLIKRFLRE